jgi:hypothetical protein
VKICGEAARFAEAFDTGSYVVHTAPRAEQLLKTWPAQGVGIKREDIRQ